MNRSNFVSPKREGILFIVSAPSGAGKTTLISRLIASYPKLKLSVSYTTRSRRAGELHGRDYFFVDEKKFLSMRARGDFAEWAEVHGFLYGTPRRPLTQAIQKGRDLLLDIDVQGARKIKRQYAQAVSVFLLPPSWTELEKRLASRGTDHLETIRQRLENARREIRQIIEYDYCVINLRIEQALEELKSIVVSERLRVSRMKNWQFSALQAGSPVRGRRL